MDNFRNKLSLFLVGVILLVLLSSNVLAIGITPARTTIDFSPGLERTVSFSVLNSEQKSSNLVVYVQGELNQSISVKETSMQILASESSKQLSYNIKLPESLSPGLHTAEVVVLQLPDKSASSEAYVGAAFGVATQIHVFVPYPGKYAEADLNVVNAEQNGEATFVIPIISRGDLDLVSVKANIDIYTKLNEKVASFNTNDIYVKSGERKEIVAKWKAEVPVGSYRAVATIIYDGNVITLEKQFSVGSANLELQQISVNNFVLGGIAKIDMLVENKWTEPMQGVYTETEVFNAKGQVMANFKSPTYNVQPLNKVVLTSYWDTAGVKVGQYDTNLYLRYGERSSEKKIQLKVSENGLEFVGLGYVISESNSSSKGGSLNTMLIIGIAVLVLINLIWFLMLRKLMKKKTYK